MIVIVTAQIDDHKYDILHSVKGGAAAALPLHLPPGAAPAAAVLRAGRRADGAAGLRELQEEAPSSAGRGLLHNLNCPDPALHLPWPWTWSAVGGAGRGCRAERAPEWLSRDDVLALVFDQGFMF